MDARVVKAIDLAWDRECLGPNVNAVVITGWRKGSGFTNTIRIITMPDSKPNHVLDIK